MDVSAAFAEALHDVHRCASAEVQALKDENARLKQLLDKAQTPQPDPEPTLEILQSQSAHPTLQHEGSMDSQVPMGRRVTHKLDDDAMAIKSLFRQRSQKVEEADTSDLYYDSGCFQWIAKLQAFEYTTLSVVVLNGFWIAIDMDLNDGTGGLIWKVMDNFFCTYFTLELIIRFGAFAAKYRVLCDGWFMFDLCLVAMMVVETWVLPLYCLISGTESAGGGNAQVLRLLRLARLSRMAKMMRSLPELAILIKGTVVGIRGVGITLVLLGGITFVFAIAMRALTDGTEVGEENFPSVPSSAYTLLIQGVLPDNGDLMTALIVTKWYYGLLFFLFIFLAALTFMNMLIGILCDAVSSVSSDEKEEIDKQNMKDTLQKCFLQHDDFHHTGMVKKRMFVQVMEGDRHIWDCLAKLDVDIPSLSDNITGIFAMTDNECMEFDDFVDVILKFRATDQSMIKGIFDLRALVHDQFSAVQTELTDIKKKFMHMHVSGGHGHHGSGSNRPNSIEQMPSSDSVMTELKKLEDMLEPVSGVLKAMQPDGSSLSDKIQRPPSLSNGRAASSSEGVAINPGRSQKMTKGLDSDTSDRTPPPNMSSSQSTPAPTGNPLTRTQQVGPQERAANTSSVSYSNGVQPVVFGATGVLPQEVNLAQKSQERMPLLDYQEQPDQVERPPDKPEQVEFPPDKHSASTMESLQVSARNPADPGADNTVSEVFAHHAYFDEHVTALEFRVSWDTLQPIVVSVNPGGEAERKGVWAGDILSQINGTDTLGKSREELLPILAVRPLLVKYERRHERTPV